MILIGSKNPHKLREVRAILEPLGVRAVIAVDLPQVEETGDTFAANAAIKALTFASFLRAPCLADDSGLVIPALDGEPGVRSARYAGGPSGDRDEANLRLVLERLAERGVAEPEAYFQCNLAIAVAGAPGEVVVETEGRVHGRIVPEPRGAHGFGYDPIFFHPESGCTLAELEPDLKNRVSHRAGALRALAERLADPKVRDNLDL
ncbi:MAG: RdgB/HAM1 family non-canonical purine NTP pyrophosphatase [Planctomycetota bacterium]